MKTRHLLLAGFVASVLAACVAAQPESPERLLHWAVEHGYYQAQFEGQVVYCQEWVPTGTHIPQTECFTEEVLAARKYNWDHRNVHPGGPTGNPNVR